MINCQNKYGTSIEIYKNGYQSNFWAGNKYDSKRFFMELRDAVITELRTQGYCELLDSILEDAKFRLDVVAYAVFADINEGFETNKMSDIENDPKYMEYIPYVHYKGSGIRWSDSEFNRVFMPSETADSAVRKVRQMLRTHQIRDKEIEKETAIRAEDKEKSGKIIEGAKEEAEKIVATAKAQADRMKEDANAEAEKIIEDAKARAKAIDDNANEQVNAVVKEKAEKLIARYLSEEQRAYKTELNEEMGKFMNSYIENSNRAMTIHTEMCDATNAFQAKWMQTLDDAIRKMTEVKSDFYSHLHNWQASLFPKEIKPLAERFLELYRIVNVDKLLCEEILLGTVSDEKSGDGEEMTDKKKDDSEIRIAGLQKLNKTLTTFLRRFELSLNGLDLYVYYPYSGDLFDETWHIPDDEEEEYVGKQIKECIVPGIAKKSNDDFGDDVLIPAVVKVKTENEL